MSDDDLYDPLEDDSGVWEAQDAGPDQPVKFRDYFTECPNCKKPLEPDMENCPYCGDILYRYLTHGTFAPRKGPLVKVFALIIALLVILAVLGLLLRMIGC